MKESKKIKMERIKKGKCFSAINKGQRKKSDFYQTPYSITKQLLENENFEGNILEPAAGKGAITKVLKENNYNDIIELDIQEDFIAPYNFVLDKFDNVITNPPYSLAFEFIEKAKKVYQKKIAMLLPLSYLHGQKRYERKIFNCLKYIYVFTRYSLLESYIRKDGLYFTGMIVYAWYIWEKSYKGKPKIKWLDNNNYIIRKNKSVKSS